jgi:protein-disulfide isomerase
MTGRRDVVDTIASVVLAAAAVAAVITMIRTPRPVPVQNPNSPPVQVSQWERLLQRGHWIGPRDASVVIVEFGDYECPVCAAYHRSTLQPFLSDHHEQAALVFLHWPLDYHRFAYPAARASECAAAQGQFAAYHELLYAKQDSLGLKSFHDIGVDARVPDMRQFDQCNRSTNTVARIDADIADAIAVGGTGTPTIIVNGFRYGRSPTRGQLDSVLASEAQR